MKPKEKRRLLILGALSLAATGGLVWLAMAWADGSPAWASAAVASPLAMRCLLIFGGCVAAMGVLLVLLVRMRARTAGASPRAFHGDQTGTAAVEMAFVFPFALMIFLMMTQSALLFNANMVVHYASYCAARVAVTTVPMLLNNEIQNHVWPMDETSQGPSEKIELIRRAAVLALMPVSAPMPSVTDPSGAGAVSDPGGSAVESQTRATFSALEGKDQWWFKRIQRQYGWANAHTRINLEPPGEGDTNHWKGGNPDATCPFHTQRQSGWSMQGWTYARYCRGKHHVPEIWDYNYWEDLTVTITYEFLLQVPYADVFLGTQKDVPGREGRSYVTEIAVVTSMSNEGGPELLTKDAVTTAP